MNTHQMQRSGAPAGQQLNRRCSSQPRPASSRSASRRGVQCRAAQQDPLLLRVARGEEAERTPVWLMRQAGRYMAAFRAFSDKYPFRMRSETPDIAIPLSMQPWRAFKPDGVIFFSDILTPLPAMGVEFDVVKGKGPIISTPLRTWDQARGLQRIVDPSQKLPFINTILSTIRGELKGTEATLLGFIGTPWTLAAYSIEGKAERDCKETKRMMMNDPKLLHAILEHLTDSLITYAGYQIESGAQVIQLFDSWAHHLSPGQFAEFSKPYADRVAAALKAKYPLVPVIFHANGGTGKLEHMTDLKSDVVGLDWATDIGVARRTLGAHVKVQGNLDPMVLFGPEEAIVEQTNQLLLAAGPSGHILNVGHGVVQGTPEAAVGVFCEAARQSGALFAKHGLAKQGSGAQQAPSKQLVGV